MLWQIKDTSFGQRLKLIRKFRKLTQRELGILMGDPDNSADVRIAQYELNYRVPKKETVKKLSEILRVSPAVFSQTICGSYDDLLQSMYWLSLMKGGGDIYECLDRFDVERKKYDKGELSLEEYLERMFTM